MVTIYRKDVLNTTSYVYPKTFAFDMSRFVLEDIPSAIPRRQTFLNPEDFGLLGLSNIYCILTIGFTNCGLIVAYERNYFKYKNTESEGALLFTIDCCA